MGRLGHKSGGALHRSWRDHEKPTVGGAITYAHSKQAYAKRKEMQEVQKQLTAILQAEKQAKRDAQKKKREQRENKEKAGIAGAQVVDAKKVKKMTKQQIKKQGIIKV
ncbi:Conserved_hypothetical protein [Hexamita inflata]|uniref:Coiled-coil domain-containing protein 86 n=1 Tax=Hexamita inflata TaxID=28002 RepID=A0AA86NYF0_9EUKA|nr:Conserved hypothetical protein [Hexamita inflata]CAI9927332.1 Conserved hypothetical protein [Hexamita inflata]